MSKKKNKWNDYLVVITNGDYDLDKALKELAKDSKEERYIDDFPLRGEEYCQTQSEQSNTDDTINFLKRRIETLNNKLSYAEYENKRLNNVINDLKGTIKTLRDSIEVIDDNVQYSKDIIDKLKI